jgi:hypothetical protein
MFLAEPGGVLLLGHHPPGSPEEPGQTMHFFSEPYLPELLLEWTELRFDPIEITHRETGEKFKQVPRVDFIRSRYAWE